MPFDPANPANNAALNSAEMRGPLTSLHRDIQGRATQGQLAAPIGGTSAKSARSASRSATRRSKARDRKGARQKTRPFLHEAAVFPREGIGDFLSAEVFFVTENLEEAVAEEFGDGGETLIHSPSRLLHPCAALQGCSFVAVCLAAAAGARLLGHGVEAPFPVEQAVGGEDVEMRVEDEVLFRLET
jgi:hypothetical protein